MSAKAQQPEPIESIDCGVFKDVKYKNGIDTILVKAIFRDASEMVPGGIALVTLGKEKKIKSKDFDYQIGFQPENCLRVYYGPSNIHKSKLIFGNPSIIDKLVYVKCVVFERHEWEYNGRPFFVVIDVMFEKPKGY